MKKIKNMGFILIVGALALIAIALQWNFERYMTQQNEKYHILQGKRRISYMPVVVFFVKNIFVPKNPMNSEVANCIYKNASSENFVVSEGNKDQYMINCYYDQSEKEWELEHCKIEEDTTKKDSIPDKIIYVIP